MSTPWSYWNIPFGTWYTSKEDSYDADAKCLAEIREVASNGKRVWKWRVDKDVSTDPDTPDYHLIASGETKTQGQARRKAREVCFKERAQKQPAKAT